MKKLEISDIKIEKPDYQTGLKPKDKTTLEWLILWVKTALEKNEISYGDILPPKKDLAAFLGISTGTLQNAIRCAEDMGYFTSKQCVGTFVKSPKDNGNSVDKMISKKDKAVIEIKKYIYKNKLSLGDALPSAREISNNINTSQNTVRLALEYLVQLKILRHKVNHGNKSCFEYFNTFEMSEDEINTASKIAAEPLYKKIKEKIKSYLTKNYKIGDKIYPNEFFAKKYKVSIRTINDAMKELNKEKIILSRRGQYGTTYLNEPKTSKQKEPGEKSLFMSNPKGQSVIKNTYLYNWERIVDQLKKFMIVNHETGDKIPSMKELASILNVSSNTVRKAVSELVKDGILFTQRGKYGGVYIVEMPAKEDAFTWLALNPKFILKDRG